MAKRSLILFTLGLLMLGSPSLANGTQRSVLPQCSTDSFVTEAGEDKDKIYGDESGGVGERGGAPPPYFGFTAEHRIGKGIHDLRAAELTTGHGSYMPSAWGGDEWHGSEWNISAPPLYTVPSMPVASCGFGLPQASQGLLSPAPVADMAPAPSQMNGSMMPAPWQMSGDMMPAPWQMSGDMMPAPQAFGNAPVFSVSASPYSTGSGF